MRIDLRLLPVAVCAALLPGAASAQDPLSAIDWLSESVTAPVTVPAPANEPAISSGVLHEDISTTSIDAPSWNAAGILSPAVTGLPRTLWQGSASEDLAVMIRELRASPLPAVQDLIYTLLLAELDPPADSRSEGKLFFARVDKLLELGALDPAMALLDQVGHDDPEVFRRFFDVALLTGDEDRACDAMRETPGIAPTFPARIFCLARGGDWNAAALSLRTGQALGYITDDEEALLSRFLDPELHEGEEALSQPARPSPLVWRMFEALGEPIPTQTLPVAFAQADLRSNTGWKAQIEAAERLARLGALPPNRLLGLYAERVPAASGGVWDRVRAVQKLDAAMRNDDAAAVAEALPLAWDTMGTADLQVALAHLYGEDLIDMDIDGDAGDIAMRIALLSPAYEEVAQDPDIDAFLAVLAKGDVEGAAPPTPMATAVHEGLSAGDLPEDFAALVAADRMGEALLLAIQRLTEGAAGNLRGVTEGLATLRHLGLEDTARRTALQFMILDPRG